MNNDAICETGRLSLREREIQLLLSFTKDLLSQRIRGKQSIATGMPLRRIPRILRMVNDDDGHFLTLLPAL